MNTGLYERANRVRRILVAVTDDVLAENLTRQFRVRGYLCDSVATGEAFELAFHRHLPQLVIVAFNQDEAFGLSILGHLRASGLSTPSLMLADRPTTQDVVEAMKLGALDVLSAPFDPARVCRVVDELFRCDARITSIAGGYRSVGILGFPQLTPRERNVLQLITDGKSNKECARILDISHRTVEVHRARVMSKLGARNAAELLRVVLTSAVSS